MIQDLELRQQVIEILRIVQRVAPGKSVEIRVPPYAAIQCIAGKTHRRGTPPNVVEMNGQTLVKLIHDPSLWEQLCLHGDISASGTLSNLSNLFTEIGKLNSRILKGNNGK
jgi:hypothetical protein